MRGMSLPVIIQNTEYRIQDCQRQRIEGSRYVQREAVAAISNTPFWYRPAASRMPKAGRFFGLALVAALLLFATDPACADSEADWTRALTPVLKDHCYECHSGTQPEGGLDLQQLARDLSDPEAMRRWILVHDRVAAGEMPPREAARLGNEDRNRFVSRIAVALTAADRQQREVVLRRLNRVEYENTLRDLFGVRVDVKDMLPEDASAQGFDNVGAALAFSSEQMQAYLLASDAALDEAFGPDKQPERIDLRFPLAQDTERHHGKLFLKTGDGVVLFSSGYCPSAFRSFRPKAKGTYRVRIRAKAFQTGKPVVMAVYGGDVIAKRRSRHLVGHFDVQPGDDWTVVEFTDYIDRYDSFLPKPYRLSHRKNKRFEGIGLLIGDVEIEGPIEAWPPPSRVKLFGEVDSEKGTLADARAILARFLPKAFRRKTEPEEVASYVGLVESALKDGRSFEEALRIGLKAVLTSPEFLFLDERLAAEPETDGNGKRLIDDFALASRLSYFLWSSMPDETLLTLAADGKLSEPAALRAQVERMLKDERAAAFTKNFTGQWLDLRDIDFTEPDGKLYPEFDDLLRASMLQETQRYFRTILEENRSLLEFVDADWAMLNERLAEHYGIPGVKGQKLRRVELPARSIRGGVVTQASVLKVTANGTNTSPVVRGVWVLENIVGRPTQPPPPNVPALEPDIRGATTIREQLAKHRSIATCAACHARIDPPGFALEQFDVIGGEREWYRSLGEGERVNRFIDNIGLRRVQYRRGPDVDASGTLADGREFEDVRQFKRLLLADPDQITRCLTEKLLIYALGRELGFSDRPAVESIVAKVRAQQRGFRSLIHEIVQSETFRQQ